MSLLLDALRQAETGDKPGQVAPAPQSGGSPDRDPGPEVREPGEQEADLELTLLEGSPQEPLRTGRTAEAGPVEQADQLDEQVRTMVTRSARQVRRTRRLLYLAMTILLLGGVGGVIYLWNDLNGIGGIGSVDFESSEQDALIDPGANTFPGDETPSMQAGDLAVTPSPGGDGYAVEEQPSAIEGGGTKDTATESGYGNPEPEPKHSATVPPARIAVADSPAAALSEATHPSGGEPEVPLHANRVESDAAPIRITRKRMKTRTFRQLRQGFEALREGAQVRARQHFERALREEPGSVPAISALAAMAYQEGDTVLARQLYQRVLAKRPDDIAARATLLMLDTGVDDQTRESRLHELASDYPEQALPHAMLANFQMAHRRWREAEAAWFKAFELDPENPDYAFNLAVSLDRLGKPAATLFYRKALELSKGRTASFSPATVHKRLLDLRSRAEP